MNARNAAKKYEAYEAVRKRGNEEEERLRRNQPFCKKTLMFLARKQRRFTNSPIHQ
jgi:hypothetical protein